MKKAIDEEIRALEDRMARRRHEVADSARLARQRAVGKLVSPAGLATAAGLGFLLTFGLLRRKRRVPVDRRRAAQKQGKAATLLSLAMPVALGLVRAQFGSPAGLAQHVLARMKKRPSPAGDARARPVHLAR